MPSRKQKWLALALIVLVLACLSVGAVFAYLSVNGGYVKNNFEPDVEPDPVINENFSENVKTDVQVNVGKLDYAVYVRAVIVVTWEDAAGDVFAQMPVLGTDYELLLNEVDWFKQGDFYYLAEMVEGEGVGLTPILINKCQPLKSGPEGYKLHVEIIAQTIQALGTTDGDDPIPAVTDAWNIEVDGNGKLVKPSDLAS